MFGSRVLGTTDHTSQPWRIHEFTNDFRLLDVWALPTPGGPDDFPDLLRLWVDFRPGDSSILVRGLFAIRWALGRALGLDRPQIGPDGRVKSLRYRMPTELQDTTVDFAVDTKPFSPLFVTRDELALELANQTVHGVLHLGWVRADTGGYRGQLAILVKPNGVLGSAYLAAIAPFRHVIVYPLMIRHIASTWRDNHAGSTQPIRGGH